MIYCCDLTQCLISIPTPLSLEMMSCDEFFNLKTHDIHANTLIFFWGHSIFYFLFFSISDAAFELKLKTSYMKADFLLF